MNEDEKLLTEYAYALGYILNKYKKNIPFTAVAHQTFTHFFCELLRLKISNEEISMLVKDSVSYAKNIVEFVDKSLDELKEDQEEE